MGFKVDYELLTSSRLKKIMLGQQEVKGFCGHQSVVGLVRI